MLVDPVVSGLTTRSSSIQTVLDIHTHPVSDHPALRAARASPCGGDASTYPIGRWFDVAMISDRIHCVQSGGGWCT